MSSLEFQQVQAMTFVDPRVAIDTKPKWVIRQGPPNVSYENIQAPSTAMTAQTIQLQVPNLTTIVDREMKMVHDVKIVFQGVATGGAVVVNVGDMDALRRLPIQQMLSAQNLKLNQENITSIPNQYIQQFGRYQSNDLCDTELSTAPMYSDSYAEYNQFIQYGDVRNALGNFGDNERPLRGGFAPYSIDYNNATGASMSFLFEEPLQVSPLKYNFPHQDKGFVGLNNITVNMTYQNNPQMIWSHANGTGTTSTLTSVVPSYNAAPTLYANFMDANNLFAAPDPSKPYYYEILTPDAVLQNYGSVAPGAQFTAQSAVVQLTSLPKAIMVYAKERLQDMTFSSTDTTAWIRSLQVAFMNKQNILANASPRELYRIARQNGYQGSWLDWSKFSGSVLVLVFSKDIPIPATQATSLQGKFQVQVQQAACTSLYPTRTVNFDFWLVTLYEGIFEIKGGQSNSNSAVLSTLNILDATKLPQADLDGLVLGGDLFGKIKSFFTKTIPGVARKVYGVAQKVAPVVQTIASLHPATAKFVPQIEQARRLTGTGLQGGRLDGDYHICPTGGCAQCGGVGKIKRSDLRSKMVGSGLPDMNEDEEEMQYY